MSRFSDTRPLTVRRLDPHLDAPVPGRRIAVIGAGVAGLVAAHELVDAGHDVHVFEAGRHAGGHANTITVETPAGQWDVDTGFVVLNDRNYPNLDRLFDELGIATQHADMSFSVSDDAGRFEWASRDRWACSRIRRKRSTPGFTGCSRTSSAFTAKPGPSSGSMATALRFAISSPNAVTRSTSSSG